MSNLIDQLTQLQDTGEPTTFTISCRLGNPPEVLTLSKSGFVTNLDINEEKPRQTSFYINYADTRPGGAVRFKSHPHEIITITDAHGTTIYTNEDNE
mgnify:CR=1 FL=1|jgi:hypothetical protein